MTFTRPAACAAIAALLLAACGGGDDDTADTTPTTAAPTTTESAETTTSAAETTTTSSSSTSTTSPTVPVVYRQPLTGEPLASEDDILARPALAVKINNHPAARRNHSGLGVADVVFEEIVEGNITRFAAVFHSQGSNPVGPIRSGRTQDVNLLLSFNQPLFAWSGGNAGVTRIIADSPLTDLNPFKGFGSAYYRGSGSAPHNFYSSTDALWALTPPDHPGAPPQQYPYLAEGEEFQGQPTGGVELQIGSINVDWLWNADSGKFRRIMGGSDHVDVQHGPIESTNVIVMGVDYQPSRVDARSPEAQTTGEGPVAVFSDGKVVEGHWKREFSLFSLEFFDDNGERIKLSPGNTWIELAEKVPTLDPANPGLPIEILPA
ncbi:MAG: DUF3048 domain-containing protein [Acidimicrobiia bacterium]|nr:DUF3048 domain-containing protein [Acidimicrobiia bacterium]